jgi:hypothetical protein
MAAGEVRVATAGSDGAEAAAEQLEVMAKEY